jgi:DNA invertase Pin-like site-specific DNA recombinase
MRSKKHNGRYVTYYRVSTKQQSLGLEAQEEVVRNFLNGGDWKMVATFTEKESGKKNDRPALKEALRMCRIHNATLIVAKLDRLARDAGFLKTIVKDSGEAGVIFCDLPQTEGPAGKFLIGMMAEVAELEAGLISARTKAALAVAKKNGAVLGRRTGTCISAYAARGTRASAQVRRAKAEKRSADILPVIEAIRGEGKTSLRAIAAGLNERGIGTAWGGEWAATQVGRILAKEAA